MREHPVIGERIVASVAFLAPLGPIVRAEHERWNGTGYPDGLKGEEIPVESRIIHACDAFHAMASDRSYRKALPLEAIVAEFRKESGHQFDPRVVDVMLDLIEHFNLERATTGKPPIRIGVGIATGEVVAGYTGTRQRATSPRACPGSTRSTSPRSAPSPAASS